METLKLEANYRSDISKGRTKQLRREGHVTGSIFGHDSEPVPIELKVTDLSDQTRKAEGGTKSLIEMTVNGAPTDANGLVLIKEFTKDPLTHKLLDIQFQRISRKEKVHVGIPIVLIGEAPGIKLGATIEQLMYELQVNCLPYDIPTKIEVDLSEMQVGDHIRISDLKVGDNLDLLGDAEAIVVNCRPSSPARAAAEEAAAEAKTDEGA